MNERDPMTEEDVRRLLEAAGPRPPIPPEDLEAISAAARAAWRTQIRRRPAWPLAAGLAALLAVAIGLAWWRASSETATPPPEVARIEAATGPLHLAEGNAWREVSPGESLPLGVLLRSSARASLRLAGGPVLRLDTGTRVRFAEATVLDLEEGSVYLDTGSGQTVAVRTSLGTARDVGTQFAVRLEGAAAMSVRVREGKVAVERDGLSYDAPAGQELVLHGDGTLERREVAAYGPAWEWVLDAAGRFEIEGRTLQELLDHVARETGWQVRFADPELAGSAREIVLHGGIGNLRPDQAPFAVLPGAGLEGELVEGVLVIRRAR